MCVCVCKCVSLCTSISFNQSSDLMRGGKNRWCSYGERYIALLGGGEEDGYPFCVNTLTVVLIKCYYYISWFTPHFFWVGMAPIKTPDFYFICPIWVFLCILFFCLFFKKGGQRITKQAAKHMVFGIPLWKNRLLILTGIVCLHSTTNAPFTVVTPNRAYQISHTLGKSNQHAKEKTAVCPT